MTSATNQSNPFQEKGHDNPFERVNEALLAYSDKDWNYSRISLIEKNLDLLQGPYVLRFEMLDLITEQGREELKTIRQEVKWGERHSSELGVLEIVSLRINKALLEVTSDEYWQWKRPVARIAKREILMAQGVTSALWYEVHEVAGEDFDNR
jgi:hypothetical protein